MMNLDVLFDVILSRQFVKFTRILGFEGCVDKTDVLRVLWLVSFCQCNITAKNSCELVSTPSLAAVLQAKQ